MTRLLSLACLPLLLALGCARPSEQRAERDLVIGQATAQNVAVRVDQGLAAVREISADAIVLWGSAPTFTFSLEVDRATTTRLELQNTLVDAELVSIATTAPVTLRELAPPVPTRHVFELELPPGVSTFRVAPNDSESEAPFRFALMSDVQEAIDRVSDIFRRLNVEPGVRFLLGAGDLTQRGTLEQTEQYQRELLALDVPYFTTLGNHELGTDPPLYQDYFGRANFHFVFKGVEFTLLDSGSATIDPMVYDWLDGWLDAARSRVHVVSMHIPPLDPIGVRNGCFASRAEAAKLLGRLAEGQVDLTVYGHIHSYYEFENAGIPAYISGGGGAIPERFDRIGRHFMVFDVDSENGIRETHRIDIDVN
ncbi:MAG TPA: metallophosphoesterase [Polyangiaceae bacterium]|nr:metallophosphoesterase [Polyangiaceae bacterium]